MVRVYSHSSITISSIDQAFAVTPRNEKQGIEVLFNMMISSAKTTYPRLCYFSKGGSYLLFSIDILRGSSLGHWHFDTGANLKSQPLLDGHPLAGTENASVSASIESLALDKSNLFVAYCKAVVPTPWYAGFYQRMATTDGTHGVQ